MKSVKLAKALSRQKVYVRNARTGEITLSFYNPKIPKRILSPYAVEDEHRVEQTYINLCKLYTTEQIKNSNLEDLILARDVELLDPDSPKLPK